MSTRAAIFKEVARRLGGYAGDISSGTATTAVLSGLINTTRDDNRFDSPPWLLWMLDASNETDKERAVSSWDDSAGQATWVGSRSDTTYTSETYIMVPPGCGTLQEWRDLLDDLLTNTRRNAWNVTKTVSDQLYYSLANLTNVRSHEDIIAVYRRNHTPAANAGSFETCDFTANYLRYPVKYRVVFDDATPYLELRSALSADQELVVVSREPYSTPATDATTTTMPDAVAVPGLLYYLARNVKPGVDRERWDRIEARSGREYANASRMLTQIPSPEPQRPVTVRGA